MGGGDSRPRESRSNEYEPREPDTSQVGVGSTSGEGDGIQTEISAYTREGNPNADGEGPVPEFGEGEDPFAELGDPDSESDEDDERGLFAELEESDDEEEVEEQEPDTDGLERLSDALRDESDGEGDDEGDEAGQDVERGGAGGSGSEASQGRIKRMAAMATMWSGAQTGTAAVESGERRLDRIAELAARRAEEEATNPDE